MSLDDAIHAIRQQYGRGSIGRLDEPPDTVDVIPTGIDGLNDVLGIGGYPRGRIIEVFGLEESGKTTLALLAVAQAQRSWGTPAFIDADQRFDLARAVSLGVDPLRMLVSQPENGEQALDIAEALARSGECSLVVVDSVASLVPYDDMVQGDDLGNAGRQTRMLTKALRKLDAIGRSTQCTVIFINVLRAKPSADFGPHVVSAGGNALKYYASVRLNTRRGASNQFDVTVVKNRFAPPFRSCGLTQGAP